MSSNSVSYVTPERKAQLAENRQKCTYVRTFEEDGVSYPIADLIGSSRLIAVDEDTVGAQEITVGFSEFAPKSSVHRHHTHPYSEEIMYILEGCGIGTIGAEEVLCKPGDILFVPKGMEHSFYNPFEEPCKFIFLYTKGSLKKAGYAIASNGFGEIGGEIEELQKAGLNKFDGE